MKKKRKKKLQGKKITLVLKELFVLQLSKYLQVNVKMLFLNQSCQSEGEKNYGTYVTPNYEIFFTLNFMKQLEWPEIFPIGNLYYLQAKLMKH